MWAYFQREAMQVSIRELKASPARAISLIRPGEPVKITSHRKVVAELVLPVYRPVAKAAPSDEEIMQQLMDAGFIAQAATQPLVLGEPIAFPPGPNGQTMSELVIELRGPK